jgi:hypothetical protein
MSHSNPSHRTYERRWKQHARELAQAAAHTPEKLNARIFIGIFPCGVSYADREIDEGGDYKRLAFLDYRTLALTFYGNPCRQIREWIAADAALIQARRGQEFEVSSCGQTVLLGSGGAV